jgi:hypothetical protein
MWQKLLKIALFSHYFGIFVVAHLGKARWTQDDFQRTTQYDSNRLAGAPRKCSK